VCKSPLKQKIEYYKNEYQKCLDKELECSQGHFCVEKDVFPKRSADNVTQS